jgi:predicted phosphodiesterase
VAGRAAMALKTLARCGADVYVSGHMHKSSAMEPSVPFDLDGFSALMVSAGTATSTRGRGEQNSFNLLRVTARHIVVESYEWREEAKRFQPKGSRDFRHTDSGWVAA